jgi:hypothetical protein
MDSDRLKEVILKNASEIVRLHSRVHETLPFRSQNSEKLEAWEHACAEFHGRYDVLAFPGGYTGALERIVAGDAETMEAAICFLECRPYFFRSGYMFKDILRKCKRAPLSEAQASRLNVVLERVAEWQRRKAKRRSRF